MIDRIGRNRLPVPEEPEFDEAGRVPIWLVRWWSGVPGLAAVLVSGGVLVLAWLGLWERNHPAAGLARGIRAAEPADRLKAIRELGQVGAEDTEVAIPALIAGLSDPDARVRATSALAVVTVINGSIKTDASVGEVREAVDALIGSERDPNPAVRSAIAQALWMIVVSWQGPPGVIDLGAIDGAMERLSADSDAEVRHSAICGLGVIGPRISDEAPPGLLLALEDESARNRLAAAEYLTHFPRQVIRMIPALVKSMEQAQTPFRAAYAEILGQIRPPSFSADAIPSLIKGLHSPDAEVRCLAATSLAEFREAAGKAVPELLAILNRPEGMAPPPPGMTRDPVVTLVEALGRLAPGRPQARESTAAVLTVLRSADPRRRAAAAAALGGFRPDEPLVATLIESSRDRDVAVRLASLRALKDMAVIVPFPAPRALDAAMEDASPEVRVYAATCLAQFGRGLDPFVPTLLRHAERDPNAQVREICLGVLEDLGPPVVTAAAVPSLAGALDGTEPRLRGGAAIVLGRLGPSARAAIPTLIRSLKASDGQDKGTFPQARNGHRGFRLDNLDMALRAVRNAPVHPRYWIVKALGRIAPGGTMAEEAVAALMDAWEPEENELDQAVIAALGSFGPDAAPALPRLLETLRRAVADRKSWLAIWSAWAIGRIGPDAASGAEVVAVLLGFLGPDSDDGLLCNQAVEALGHFGPAAVSAVPRLIGLLRDEAGPGRATIAEALGRIAPATSREAQALDALTQSLRTELDLHGTLQVIEAIARFGPGAGPAIPRLKELVRSPDAKVSDAARSAMAALKVTH